HNHALPLRNRLNHPAALARILTGENEHRIATANVRVVRPRVVSFARQTHQSTSGASEMIFINCLSRSSRATGPKIRVPRGSPAGVITTAAFSSKRSTDPSGRRIGL